MIKTQVRIPDELYYKAKAVAKAKDWSLAEVFRRGLEYITSVTPLDMVEADWKLPVLGDRDFVENFDDLDFRELAADEEVRRF